MLSRLVPSTSRLTTTATTRLISTTASTTTRSVRHKSSSSTSSPSHLRRTAPRSTSTATSRPFTSTSKTLQAEPVDEPFDLSAVERVSDEVDVCIVGGGPAGLSAAIRIKQQAKEAGKEVRVVVLEKGGEIGESRRIDCSARFFRGGESSVHALEIWVRHGSCIVCHAFAAGSDG